MTTQNKDAPTLQSIFDSFSNQVTKVKTVAQVTASATAAQIRGLYNKATGRTTTKDDLDAQLDAITEDLAEQYPQARAEVPELTDEQLLDAAKASLKRKARGYTKGALKEIHTTLDSNFESLFKTADKVGKRSQFLDDRLASLEELCARMVVRLADLETQIPEHKPKEETPAAESKGDQNEQQVRDDQEIRS